MEDIFKNNPVLKDLANEPWENFELLKDAHMKTLDFEKLALLARRVAEVMRRHTRVRIVFDYDPDAMNMDITYFIPEGASLDRWTDP